MGITIAFTGHRPDKIGGYEVPNKIEYTIRHELILLLEKLDPKKAICGMAIGFDQLAADVCIDHEIPFIAAIPFRGFESKWPTSSQRTFRQLLNYACSIKIITEGNYAAWKMQARNKWMIDNCDLVVACWNGSPGGTANTVQYATSIGKEIRYIDVAASWSITRQKYSDLINDQLNKDL